MKVLFLTLGTYSRVGGMERFHQRVVRSLSELSGGAIRDTQLIALWDTPEHRPLVPHPVGFAPASANKARMALTFVQCVLRMQPDIILYGHVLLAPLAILGHLLSPRSRHLLLAFGIEVWGAPHRPVTAFERWVVRALIDRVVSISRFTSRRMLSVYGMPEGKFLILPCATDVEAEHLPIADVGIPRSGSREARILTVARLSHAARHKGCDKVIATLPSVIAKFPETHYYIAGEGPLKAELRTLAEQLGVGEHVHLLGYVSDQELEHLYRSADIFVMPSVGEGFGIVFLEAWRYGLPVIAGALDASSEVITHGVNGLIVDPCSIAEIGEAIIRLLGDKQAASDMGLRGYETVLRCYSHQRFRQMLSRILSDHARRLPTVPAAGGS